METWHEQQDELEKERQRAAQQSDAPDAQSSNKPLTATSAQRAKFREGVREHVSKSVQYAREEVTGSKVKQSSKKKQNSQPVGFFST